MIPEQSGSGAMGVLLDARNPVSPKNFPRDAENPGRSLVKIEIRLGWVKRLQTSFVNDVNGVNEKFLAKRLQTAHTVHIHLAPK